MTTGNICEKDREPVFLSVPNFLRLIDGDIPYWYFPEDILFDSVGDFFEWLTAKNWPLQTSMTMSFF